MSTERLKAQVWIHAGTGKQRRVLILKTNPERGSFWQPVTGWVDVGELPEQAAAREAREETGLEFTRSPKSIGYEFTFTGKGGRARESVFELEAPSASAQPRLDPHEHVEFKWMTPEDALAMLRFESNAQPLALLMKKWSKEKKEGE